MIITKKFKITILGSDDEREEGYNYIRHEQYEQYKALNLGMTLLHTNNILSSYNTGAEGKLLNRVVYIEKQLQKTKIELLKSKREEKKTKLKKIIKELESHLVEIHYNISLENDFRSEVDIRFKEFYIDDIYTVLQSQVNLINKDNMSLITKALKADYATALKNGLAKGERSLTNYKRGYPLLVRGRDLKFYYDGRNVLIKWIKGITFKVILGRNDKDKVELLHTLQQIIYFQSIENYNVIGYDEVRNKNIKAKNELKNYKVCDSSIKFEEKKLILNLALDINTISRKDLVEGRVVGVDIGVRIPIYVSLNDTHHISKKIGSVDSFIKVKQQFKARRRSIHQQVKVFKSCNRINEKIKVIDSFSEKQSRYKKSYNHFLSNEIIKFAIDNKAHQINLELLSIGESIAGTILSDWNYYQLKTMIEYKSKRYGIVVKTVDPYRTSQICSKCGNYEEEQRLSQNIFECKSCGLKVNADYNASRNIAISTKYIEKIEESEYYTKKQ